MPGRYTPLAPGQLTAAQRALYDVITGGPRAKGKQAFPLTDEEGALNGPFGLMLIEPTIGGALQQLGTAIRYHGSLSDRVREIAILQVAASADSDFEKWAHERVALTMGLDPTELDTISSGTFTSADRTEQQSYELVTELLQGGDLSDTRFEETIQQIGRVQMFELTVLVGYYTILALSMSVFDVGVPALEKSN